MALAMPLVGVSASVIFHSAIVCSILPNASRASVPRQTQAFLCPSTATLFIMQLVSYKGFVTHLYLELDTSVYTYIVGLFVV